MHSRVQISSFMTYTQVQRLPLSLMSKLTLSGHTLKSTHCFKTYSHVYRITLSRLAFKCTDELFQELNSSVQINSFTTYPHIQINSFKMRDSEPHCSIIQTNTDIWSIYIYIISNFRSLKTHRFGHACKHLPQDNHPVLLF